MSDTLGNIANRVAIVYAKLPRHLIFKDRAILFDTAIVMIMDEIAIKKAPSVDTFKMVMSTYDQLGKTTNFLTEKLKKMGFQAQASHSIEDLVVYPSLSVQTGVGWFGPHGFLVTPQFGPCQRITVIFVNIDNLTLSKGNEHSWIEKFCDGCGKCIITINNSKVK